MRRTAQPRQCLSPLITPIRYALLLWAVMAGVAHAQLPPPDPRPPGAARPANPDPAAEAPKTITLEAGTGMLLRLPRPAAAVMVAEPAIARVQPVSPTNLFLMGVSRGHTTMIVTDGTGELIGLFDVVVSPAQDRAPPGVSGANRPALGPALAREVQAQVHRSVPGAHAVSVQTAGDRLVLRGPVPNEQTADKVEAAARQIAGGDATIIPAMTILSRIQVNVRVRVVEISRTIARQLGFNWQALGSDGSWRLGLSSGGAPPPISPPGLAAFMSAPSPAYQADGSLRGRLDINGVIDALAADHLIKVLAEPNLTARSGETTNFLTGGAFPVPVVNTTPAGATTASVEFKQFGVSLALVPTVISPNRLNLRVRPDVSQLASGATASMPIGGGVLGIPALILRRADTAVDLSSGQSFAIAGLLQRSANGALPGTGDLPVLGPLFKSSSFQRGETELVIIVTPYLVRPVDPREVLPVPTGGVRPSGDAERTPRGRWMVPQPRGHDLSAGFMLR